MGRKSLAERFYKEIEVENTRRHTWVVIYDFHDSKPNRNFYTNLQRLREKVPDAAMEQYSVFKTSDMRGALTAWKLADHYGAQTAMYRAEEVNPKNREELEAYSGSGLTPHQAWVLMKAVRSRLEDPILKCASSNPEYRTLVDVLGRFYKLLRPGEPVGGDQGLLKATRMIMDPNTPTELVHDMWIKKSEENRVLNALWIYIQKENRYVDRRLKYALHHSIQETIAPTYRPLKSDIMNTS